MRRYLISTTVVLMVLLTAWVVFAQEAGKGTPAGEGARVRRPADVNRPAGQRAFEGLSPEERAKMKEKFDQMSEEEKAKFRDQMRERRPFLGREEQLKVIAAVEEQIAKLKAIVEAQAGPEEFAKMRELPEEERTKLREKFAKAREERQRIIEVIEQNIAKMRGERPRIEEQQQLIGELRAIRDLAKQEKAEGTTKRLEQLIDRQQKGPEGRLPVPGARPRGEGAEGAGRAAPTPRPPPPQPEPGKKAPPASPP